MNRVLLAGVAALALTATARADIIDYISDDAIDPTILHVGGTPDGGPGSDPNLIASNGEFFIANVSGGQSVPSPLDVFFLVPDGGAAPTITSVNGGSVSFTGPTDTGKNLVSGEDLYTLLGCSKCDNSLSFGNIAGALMALSIPVPAGFDIYEAVINAAVLGKSDLDIMGAFANGTFIAPLGYSVNGKTIYDTSFTNAGLIDGHVTPVPEASTWVMMLAGFVGLGFAGYRASRKAPSLAA